MTKKRHTRIEKEEAKLSENAKKLGQNKMKDLIMEQVIKLI